MRIVSIWFTTKDQLSQKMFQWRNEGATYTVHTRNKGQMVM